MSDYDSSLPIRTENDGDVVVRIGDGTVSSQQLKVEADGSINANISATDFDIRDLVFATDKVDVSGSEIALDAATLAALENITVSATDLDIRDLVFATDKVDVSGSSVTATVSATDLDIRDLVFATDKVDVTGSEVALDAATLAALENITVSATDLDIRDLAFSTDKVDVGGSVIALDAATLAALESITVSATDLDIRDISHVSDSIKVGDGTDFLGVNTDGSINVVIQEDVGTEIVNYNTAAAVAAGATSTQDLVFASASKLYQVLGSASGKMKVEVQVETGSATGVFNTICVRFNSTADPDCDMILSKYAAIPAGARVRVIRTNRDNQAQDVYSTIVAILG
jgi:hypothetical protein